MGDPIVISDDSDSEWSSGYAAWHRPPVLDPNPDPSYGRARTSSAAATSMAQVNAPLPVVLSTPLSPDVSVSVAGAAVNLAPGTSRRLSLLGLTEDPGIKPDPGVIDLTGVKEEPNLSEGSGRGAWQAEAEASGSPCPELSLCFGSNMVPVTMMSASGAGDAVAAAHGLVHCHVFKGFLSPVSSCCSIHSSQEQACGGGGGLDRLCRAADAALPSAGAQTPAVPCLLENYQAFESGEERSDDQRPQPIPPAKVQIVLNTIEASFPEATVQCLSEFVTACFYPPREILAHVIHNILLSPEIGNLLDETCKLLTKIQELHPATITQVEWDWELLTFVMQDHHRELPGKIFFLRYVFKTLEDDFQEALRQPVHQTQNSIAYALLSCDRQSHHIKDIIKWIVKTLSGPGFPLTDTFPLTDPKIKQGAQLPPMPFTRKSNNHIIVLYLQKMLALAVEVDRTPTCSSNKIAEILFLFVLNIPERNQREAFFTSMENHLLRCKLLETLLIHSCEKPPNLPLSFAQILYFLNNASVLYGQSGGIRWETLDELVEHLQFLLISYHRVLTDHLRISMGERKDMARRCRPPTQQGNDITALDIELQIEAFRGRMLQEAGEMVPLQVEEKLFLLKLLFLQAIHGKPLLGNRFQGGNLMGGSSLLGQEFPEHM